MQAPSLQDAASLDRNDPLRSFRQQFELPLQPDGRTEAIYLCGNSLGPMPRGVRDALRVALDDWATLGVRGHHDGPRPWIPYADTIAPAMADLVGAASDDVVVMNTLTVNLHLMMASFYRPTRERHAILIEQGAFPSDHYAVESQIRFHGHDPAQSLVLVAPRRGEDLLRAEDIEAAIAANAQRLALVLLPGIQYRTGQVLDIPRLSAAARAAGARVGWDLAHSVGNVPLSLADWDIDFAIWCTYKYLCSGPGGVAGAYVSPRHAHAAQLPRLAGWWGHDRATRFQMGPHFQPIPGAAGWQLSNPPVLALAPLAVSLRLFRDAGREALRRKSLALTGFALDGIRATLGDEVQCLTPQEAPARGCQLSLRVAGGPDRARRAFRLLSERGVVGDWREPDVIRIAPHPLFNTFAEVSTCLEILKEVVTCC